MMTFRRLVLALVAAGFAGCSGASTTGQVDTTTAAYKEQAARVEQFKNKAKGPQRGTRPAR